MAAVDEDEVEVAVLGDEVWEGEGGIFAEVGDEALGDEVARVGEESEGGAAPVGGLVGIDGGVVDW